MHKISTSSNDYSTPLLSLSYKSSKELLSSPASSISSVSSISKKSSLKHSKESKTTNPANYEESHSANYHSRNRVVSSTTAKTSTASNINDNTATIDYKKLYDETRLENVKLKSKIKDLEKELQTSKGDRKILAEIKPSSDYNSDNSSQSTLSRKEKRNLEIKISELEEELKKMESLKEVNQRLKHENGALIRVISKLSK
ncbi:unnamed protein product [Gordionus sp. m RMFG-2023]